MNGYDDLLQKKIRFVGIADKRVKEDYLRILRYFRFYGKVCDNCEYHDEASINAIKNNVDGLKSIKPILENEQLKIKKMIFI